MEIVKTLQEIVNELDSIDTYDEGIAGRLSEIDQKNCYIDILLCLR